MATLSRRGRARRNKRCTPKHIHIPIMQELQDVFMFDGHGALAAMRLAPNEAAFDQLAGIFNLIAVGLQDIGQSSVILASGMRALQDVGGRAKKTGHLGVPRHELPPLQNAVVECESLVKKLDVIRLHLAGQKLRVMESAERASESIDEGGPA
jgi:hypothetical protein